MTFPYRLFPISTAFGFNSTIDYGNGDLMVTNAGAVVAGPVRANAMRTFDFSYSTRDLVDAQAIADVLHDVRINAYPVLIRDWSDYSVDMMAFGTGDGATTKMPLYIFYGTNNPVARQIKYPEPDDLVVFEDDTIKEIASVDADGVTPVDPWTNYATLSWSGTFYVPVRLSAAGAISVTGPQGKYAELPRLGAIEDLSA